MWPCCPIRCAEPPDDLLQILAGAALWRPAGPHAVPAKRASARLIARGAAPFRQFRSASISSRPRCAARATRLHADRRAAPAGKIRRARRRLRLRHILRNRAGGRDRAQDAGEFETALRDIRYHNGIVNWYERNHYFFEWSRAQRREQDCAAGSPWTARSTSKRPSIGKRASASGNSRCGSFRAPCFWPTKTSWRPATSSASSRRRRTWIISTSVLSSSRPTASCCCATPPKAGTACWTSAWTALSRTIACATSRCCGRKSRRQPHVARPRKRI